MKNKNYFEIQEIIKELVDSLKDTDCYLSIFGSSIYGKKEGTNVKPNIYSDIDSNLIINKEIPLKNLERLLNPIPVHIVDLFLENHIDILSLRGNYKKRNLLIQCMNRNTLQRIVNPDKCPLVMYKEKKDKSKKINPVYEFDIFGINRIGKDTTKLLLFGEGNLIIYKNTNFPNSSKFYLTLQQRQILTQKEYLDKENYLSQQRLLLQEKLKQKFPKKNLIGFFAKDLEEWSDEFKKEIELRLK